MVACLCWIDDEAGEGQSAQVRATPDVVLTGDATQCSPQVSLLSFSSSFCLWAPAPVLRTY